jgi:TolB-like protein/predicted Ser/Thr protein kinase
MNTVLAKTCRKCGAKLFGDEKVCGACMLETALGPLIDDGVDLVGADRTKAQSPMMDFGDYELLEEIGRGGQGVVYRARQKSLNRTVALKVIGLGHFASTPHLKRFRQEAEAAARLEHSQIVPIYEIGERDGSCYFSMKFIEGGQLDNLLKREPMSIRRAVELLVKIARTVQFAHEHGILHRDIKPGNILLDRHGEPHLTDFGLARLIENQSTVTNSFDVLGTPSYMAPEQAAGRAKELTAAADVYSLGAVFYQVLTGEPPFAGGTTYETIRLVMETEPRNPRIRNPKIDVDLATICLKCLEKDPAKRYPSAGALADDLERWLRHEPIRARPANVFTRTRKWIRRNQAKAVLIPSLAAVVVLAFNSLWNREPAPPADGIAVLPFENLSGDNENTFLADGIQDDILTKLAKIADLKVISRTSVMQYRGERNIRKIGNALRVSHLLEGSLRREGQQLHLNAQLIDARNDQHVWAEQYDVAPANLFSIQSEIAQNIAKQLKSKVSSTEKAAINTQPTSDLEAYKLYQQARELTAYASPDNPATHENGLRAVDFLEKAVARDPNFVLAHCLLVHTSLNIYWSSGRANLAHRDRAEIALREAQRMAPDAGETHLAAAAYYHYGIRDYDRALEQLDIAARLLPNSADVFYSSALVERRLGRWSDALRHFSKANELNPRDPSGIANLILTHNFLRHFAEADKLTDRAIAIFPEKADEFWNLKGLAALNQGDLERARAAMDKISSGFPHLRFLVFYYERKFAEAEAMSLPVWQGKEAEYKRYFTIYSALAAHAAGATDRMWTYLLTARQAYEPFLSAEPDAETLSSLGMIDVALGRTEEGIAECRKAVELEPMGRNAMEGPWYVRDLALAYAWAGDRDRAIEQLSRVVKVPNVFTGFGECLKLDPIWDPLRNDPRFAQILAEAAKPLPLQ